MRAVAPAVLGGVLLLSCGGDSGIDSISGSDNQRPQIVALAVAPADVAVGGTAAVVLVARDADGDDMTASARAARGTVALGAPVAVATAASASAEKLLQWTGTYTPTSAGEDSIAVTVSDGKGQTASSTSSPLHVGPGPASPTVAVSCNPASCHPKSETEPCTSTCTAIATDPNDDPLTYRWSGCATGSESTATCSVAALGAHVATVAVSDGITATATASADVQGTNVKPETTYLGLDRAEPIPCTGLFDVRFSVTDADGDPIGDIGGAIVGGGCTVRERAAHEGWFHLTLYVFAGGPHTCRVQASARDAWEWSLPADSPSVSVCP